MNPECQKQYSPSIWNKRLPVDHVVPAHGEFLAKKSDQARQKLLTYTFKFSESDPEQSIEIAYLNPNSFSVSDLKNSFNFNGRKIFVYLHGGYWQWGSFKDSIFMSENFCSKNIITVAIGYTIAPNASMSEIFNQVERAIAKILENSGNSEVYICGHSAGGHLATMLLFSDFKNKYNVDTSNLKGIIPVSGIFDLGPILETDINDNLKMDMKESSLLSPLLRKDVQLDNKTAFLIAYAENDSPAFHKQAEDFKIHLTKFLGFKNVKSVRINNSDHFDIIENISLDNFSLTKEIYDFMNIN